MNRFVVPVKTFGGGDSYVPVEWPGDADSLEAALREAWYEARDWAKVKPGRYADRELLGFDSLTTASFGDFSFSYPKVMTVDEWFTEEGIKGVPLGER